MIDLKKFKALQKAYNDYVKQNTINNKNIYIKHIDNCIRILQKENNNQNNKRIKFFLNTLNSIRTKIILPIGDETDHEYTAKIIENEDKDRKEFEILKTELFYKNLIKFFEAENKLQEAGAILNRKQEGGFIKGDENLLKVFNELRKKLNNT